MAEKSMHDHALDAFVVLGALARVAGSRAHLVARAELANVALIVSYCEPAERQQVSERLVALSAALGEAHKKKGGIYVASKTVHAPKWRELRAGGEPIVSTWIDEAGEGETSDFSDLWKRCIREAAEAVAFILYAEPGDILKGAFVETGVALGAEVPVFVVGEVPGSFVHHKLVTRCATIEEAFIRANALVSKRA